MFWTKDPEAEIDELDLITQPDVSVVCDPEKLRDEGIVGAPDFIIEVLSPGTAYRDQTENRGIHEQFGVREYWLVNPATLEVWI